MATSGSSKVTLSPYDIDLVFSWSATSQSIANNTTTISWTMSLVNNDMYNTSNKISNNGVQQTWTVTIDGTKYTGKNLPLISSSTASKTLASGTATITHNANGSKTFSYSFSQNILRSAYPNQDGPTSPSGSGTGTLNTIARQATLLTAANFTDEENPKITYSNPAGSSATTLQACISLDGTNATIAYRNVSKTGSSYTFELTDAERDTLRAAIPDKQSATVYFILKSVVGSTYTSKLSRTLTIVNCAPELTDPVVKNMASEISELTGDENKLIRYVSMVEYGVTATAKKYATIVNQSITNGTKTIEGLAQGVIDDVESGLFVFSATDSRGLSSQLTVEREIIDYVKPTCYQTATTEMSGETGAVVHLTIKGNYFNDTFGAVHNTLKLEVRHTQNDGTMGDWNDLTSVLIPVFDGNTYTLETTISGFDYSQAYTFQCRATDKLNTVISAQYTVRVLPVFDWSEEDFNFNVPVNINGQTVLRHNKEANNTVISASGGHIYLRPNGTDDTTGEVVINPDGTIVSGGSSGDYIVETGSEAMGSNGTWYWEKWNSGKAICWGKRNFGKMAITTAITNIYRSAMYTQDFPSGLFIAVPEVINTSISSSSAYWGGWVLLSNPTASSTGNFAVAHSNSLTLSASNIGFYVVGRWKADPVTVWVNQTVTKETAGAWYHWEEDCPAFASAGITPKPLVFDSIDDIPSDWKLCTQEQ